MAKIRGMHARLLKEQTKEALENKGYVFFDGGSSFNLNIIGVRSVPHDPDKFNDTIIVVYRNEDKEWEVLSYEVTTEPGPKILRKPINSKGTAILVPDQYRGAYKVGIHGGSYRHTALIQRGGKVKVWRDNNLDSKIDTADMKIDEGMFGINIHRHSRPNEKEYVNGSSAGCQVFKNSKEFAEFLDVCNKSADIFGNSFTYTLIEEGDF